jgi:hypothetical protein
MTGRSGLAALTIAGKIRVNREDLDRFIAKRKGSPGHSRPAADARPIGSDDARSHPTAAVVTPPVTRGA